ncbi:hypothetical protein SB444474_0878, partial [Shigella boydii 4444-74]
MPPLYRTPFPFLKHIHASKLPVQHVLHCLIVKD